MPVTNSPPIRVLHIDDHPIVRAGLRLLIESSPQLHLIAQAGNRAEALAAATQEQPDVIVLDLDLGPESGLDFLAHLLRAAPHSRILILTGVRDVNLNLQALQQGAMGVVTKDQASENLIQAIQKINAGEAWLDGVTTAKMITYLADLSSRPDPEAAKIGALTQREYKIIQLVCEGHKNQGIADCLLISEGTVRNHLTVIYHKLGVKDRFGLIVYATQHKLNHPADPIPIAPD